MMDLSLRNEERSFDTTKQPFDSFNVGPDFHDHSVNRFIPCGHSLSVPPPQHTVTTPSNTQEGRIYVSVSTTFHPSAELDAGPSDLTLLSADYTYFHVHSRRILSASTNGFNNILPTPRSSTRGFDIVLLSVPESSSVLNIILHTAYGLSCSQYCPSFPDLRAAVAAMKIYGMPLPTFIAPSSPLSLAILAHAPASPLEVYTLAASNNLHDMAVSASPHLLSYPLSSLTDDEAHAIGPVYVKDLFLLQQQRVEALKHLLLPPPHPHPETAECDFAEQRKLTRAWTLASAYLAWEARADLSTGAIEAALLPLTKDLPCDQCQAMLRTRVKELVVKWAQVKPSI